jgi:hypothetical protein
MQYIHIISHYLSTSSPTNSHVKPHYKFYLNMQDIHIIFHYLSISSPTNSHIIPLIFNLLM